VSAEHQRRDSYQLQQRLQHKRVPADAIDVTTLQRFEVVSRLERPTPD